MLVKDMYLKKSSLYLILFFIIIFLVNNSFSEESLKRNAINYLKELKFFSASFIQDDLSSIAEGKIFVGENRIRVDYENPTKILIILDENKAMYYDYELEEDEFFDPSGTSAKFFFNIFKKPDFFGDSDVISRENYLVLSKSGKNENIDFTIKVFFENNPFLLRKAELLFEDKFLVLSIFNHKYNEAFDKNFFKLINPSFFN